jgi:hypothetical protein
MLLKTLSDVTFQDVQTLCEDCVLEGRFYDFKADAIGSADRDKREFLADVTAFANAAGGDLILGVRTKDGAADDICGIDLIDPDKETQRLINLVRACPPRACRHAVRSAGRTTARLPPSRTNRHPGGRARDPRGDVAAAAGA